MTTRVGNETTKPLATSSNNTSANPENLNNQNLFALDELTIVASRLEMLDVLREKVEVLEASTLNKGKRTKESHHKCYREEEESKDEQENLKSSKFHHTKIEFPKFNEGDPWGWILKAEKYF